MGIAARAHDEQGYAMAALLVAMSVMAVWWSVALPVWSTQARREKEAELIFRGEQYARAIAMFQRRYGNAIPPSVDVLIEQKFLRKRYKDPITGDDFEIIGPGSQALAQAIPARAPASTEAVEGRRAGGQQLSGPGQRGLGAPAVVSQFIAEARASIEERARQAGALPQDGPRAPATPPSSNGVIGVRSKSPAKALRLYNGADNYNEWLFLGTQQTTRPTVPPGSSPAPGGAGVPGRGGIGGLGPEQAGGANGPGSGPGGRGRRGFELPRQGGTQPPPGTFPQPRLQGP